MTSSLETKVKQARERLDAQVRDVVQWHFSPETGTPFWLEKAKELKLNPRNASAEYYLGELARQGNNLKAAIEHYSRATGIYPEFAEAYAGLGRCLLDSSKTVDAVAPLETAARLAPENPAVHCALATAYQRLGRKEDAAREFSLQKSTSEKINQTTKTLHKNVSGAETGKH